MHGGILQRHPVFFIAQYAFKFAHERIAVLVGEYMRMYDLFNYPL